jgi:hypothetical protein
MRSSRLLPEQLKKVIAGSFAVRGLRITAMAGLAVCIVGNEEVRAETAIDRTPGQTVSSKITCRGSHRANKVPSAGDHRSPSIQVGGKIVTPVPIWKTVTLGTHENASALRRYLTAARCRVGDLAKEVLNQPEFTVSKSRTEVNLAVVSVADLGFGEKGASRAEIYQQAAQLGLDLCPPEVALQLRLQYLDQPLGEFLHIAMEPVATAGGDFVGLSMGNGGAGLLLIGGDARPDLIVPPTVRFVFVRHSGGTSTTAADGH